MKPIKIKIDYQDGSYWYVDDQDIIRSIGKTLPRDIHWKKSTAIKTLRSKYFAMVEQLAKDVNSGQNKTSLHNALKPLTIGQLADMPHYFIDGTPSNSVSKLNLDGLAALLEQLKSAANDIFGYVFVN